MASILSKMWIDEVMEMEPTVVESRLVESHEALRARVEQLEAAIRKHHEQHADDLCWMDDDELYAAAGLPARHATVGDPKAMLRNCKRFIRQRCQGAGDWPTYADLEARIKELESRLEILDA